MGDAERKRAVREWFRSELNADRAEFMRRTKLSKGRATQILTGEDPFGEKAAINLARRAGLADDRFLGARRPSALEVKDSGVPLAVKYEDLLRLWDKLFDEQKENLLKAIRIEHQKAVAVLKEMRVRGLLKEDVPENVLPPEFTRQAQRELLPLAPPKRPATPRGRK